MAFSFAVAALIDGRVDAAWGRWVRPWTLAAWVFLTIGIAMGSWWSYYVLGWGGFWFLDPVENASLMPWLIATFCRETALVANNILLSVAYFTVFIGTVWPLIAQILFARTFSVGPPFFDTVFPPFLIAAGRLMPWKRAQLGRVLRPLIGVAVLAVAVLTLVWAMQKGRTALGPVGARRSPMAAWAP